MTGKAVDKEWYDLSDLEAVRTWNYTAPTLVKPGRFTNRKAWLEASSFWTEFTKQFPVFEHIDINGMAIFGGAVQDLLIDRTPNDIDMCFFHEGTPHDSGIALRNRVELFVQDIYNFIVKNNKTYKDNPEQQSYRLEYDLDNMLVTRYKNCYEIKMDCNLCNVKIQITHRPNVRELFKQVDIACTGIAYYDGRMLMDEKAKFALESCVIEVNVDVACTSKTYTKRLMKYFLKGYDIILRDLNMGKLDRRNLPFGQPEVLDLPDFTVVYSGITDNKVEVQDIKDLESDEEDGLDYATDGMGVGEIIHKNVKSLVNGKFDEFVSIGQGETFKTVFNPNVVITERMITNCYQTVKDKLSVNAFDLGKIQEYYTCRDIDQIMKDVIVDFAAKECSYDSDEFKDYVKLYLEKLTSEQVEVAKKMVLDCKGKGSLDIVPYIEEVKEGTSGCAKKDFYGEYSN